MQFAQLSAIEAASLIRNGDITSLDLVTACLRRIEQREPEVAAWAHLNQSYAIAQATSADNARASGAPLGPLHGVPVGIKDIIDTADLPTENGTVIFAGRRPSRDASVVRQLKAAGAIILGKTVTTELAFFGPGKTRNPHNTAHTPGGSSSGSAAAVADFQVPLALGTQTAGSIVRPASYCGTFGFKPTFGLVSRSGVMAQSAPLDTIGGYARTLADLALLIDCMSMQDAEDDATPTATRPAKPLLASLDTPLARPPRFAFVKTLHWPEGDKAMQDAMLAYVRALGAACDEISLPAAFDDTAGLQRAVQFHDIAESYGPHLDAHPDVISAKLKEVIGVGRTVSDHEYRAALGRRGALYQALLPLFDTYDAILTPAAPGAAPAGLTSTGSPMFNFLWTYLGMPAVSLPRLSVGAMPLGVQLIGRRNDDAGLIAQANSLMAIT